MGREKVEHQFYRALYSQRYWNAVAQASSREEYQIYPLCAEETANAFFGRTGRCCGTAGNLGLGAKSRLERLRCYF